MSLKRKRLTDEYDIACDLLSHCDCDLHSNYCGMCFSVGAVVRQRISLSTLSETELNNFLYDRFSTFFNIETGLFTFVCGGVIVCGIGCQVYFGLSDYKMNLIMNSVRTGVRPVHGNSLRDYNRELEDRCEAWLSYYCEVYGDHMPHRPWVYLLPHMLKQEVYDIFCT